MKIVTENGTLSEHGKEFVSHFESDIDAIFLSHEFITLTEEEQRSLESILKALVADKFSKNRLVRQKFTERTLIEREQRLASEFDQEGVVTVTSQNECKCREIPCPHYQFIKHGDEPEQNSTKRPMDECKCLVKPCCHYFIGK